MGQPVVHFEIAGKDVDKLKAYYSDLFGWEIDSDNPMNYGLVQRDGNVNADGVGIGGGIGQGPEGYPGHVTFYVEVPDVEAALAKAESLGGSRMWARKVMDTVELGQFTAGGHLVGLVKARSRSGHFGGRLDANVSPGRPSVPDALRGRLRRDEQPFRIGRLETSGRHCLRIQNAAASSGSIRTIRSSPSTPQHMFPTRKAMPPNILRSATSGCPSSTSRTRRARSSSNAIGAPR
jgi:predicted enzyme related to lactoylglutathione lyase